ncbi:MAG: N-formylglutamate amidohydrolase [Paracoccus sp. (in: a-proteobacteria)]
MLTSDAFSHELHRPSDWASGVIVCSPHSGRDFPEWFLAETCLDLLTLRSSEDAFMDRMITPALAAGAVTLHARLPRSIVDLNRSAAEIDPEAVRGAPRRPVTPRASIGLGVIPRVVSGGLSIRPAPIAMAEARRRIDLYWRPYHGALRALIAEAQQRFGWAIVIDMHSMPREAIRGLTPPLPEVVIGDRRGTSCGGALREAFCRLFRDAGFRLRLNQPFSGAYIASAYGRPMQGVHVLQVEIDRALYLDAARMQPSEGYDAFAARLAGVMRQAARLRPDATGSGRIAAE